MKTSGSLWSRKKMIKKSKSKTNVLSFKLVNKRAAKSSSKEAHETVAPKFWVFPKTLQTSWLQGVTTHTVFSWLEYDLINLHRQLQLSDSSVETKQKQSVELLQLLDYNAAKRDARCWFIETVTSAGQDNFNYYKDRTPWPENVASAHGNVELAPLQDVHPRYCVKLHVGHPHVY